MSAGEAGRAVAEETQDVGKQTGAIQNPAVEAGLAHCLTFTRLLAPKIRQKYPTLALISRYSFRPCAPHSRPLPDCRKPPNGTSEFHSGLLI